MKGMKHWMKLCELREYKWNEYVTIAVNRNLSNCENSPVFHSFHGLMNSMNWPASSIWVFIAQLREHCSANAEATDSNPVKAPKNFFSGYFRNWLNCDSLRWSHTHFKMTSVGKNTWAKQMKCIRTIASLDGKFKWRQNSHSNPSWRVPSTRNLGVDRLRQSKINFQLQP